MINKIICIIFGHKERLKTEAYIDGRVETYICKRCENVRRVIINK